MSTQYQINYLVDVTDRASATLKQVEKNLKAVDQAFKKMNSSELTSSKARLTGVKADEEKIKKLKEDTVSKSIAAAAKERKSVELGFLDINKKRKSAEEKSLKEKESALRKAEEVSRKNSEKILKEKESASIREANIARKAAESKIKEERRATEQTIKDIRKQEKERERANARAAMQRRQAVSQSYSNARGAALAISTPATANAAFAIKNAMTREQMGISLRTQFGQESGNLMFQEMRDYSLKTAFSMEEAVQLISDMKIGQNQLGIKTDQELVALTKKIGNILIAFGKNPENRAEIANQLGQIAMSDKANTRQDLKVMQKRGMPVFQALQAYTGMTFTQLQDKFGSELPSKLIIAALEALSDSPQVLQAMDEQSKSLTQAWGNLKEQTFFTSSAYGLMLDKQFKIGEGMHSISSILGTMEDKMMGVSKESLTMEEKAIGFGTAMVITVPTLTAVSLLMQRIWASSLGASNSSNLLKSRLLSVSGIMSGVYLATVDWGQLVDDIKDNGLAGWTKHLDVITASALTLLTTFQAIRAAATWAATATTLGVAGAATGGAAVAAYAGYKAGQSFGGSDLSDKILNRYYEKTGQKDKMIDIGVKQRNQYNLTHQQVPPQVNVQINNSAVMDKNGVVGIKTSAKSAIGVNVETSNNITHEMWKK